MRARAPQQPQSGWLVVLCFLAWIVPGAGHLWQGRRVKGLILLVALVTMFSLGLIIEGRLFPFQIADPLPGLMCIAELGIGAPYFIASAIGAGEGRILAVTYEYGNAFMIAAGLLNMLVVADAYDIALGRK